MTMRNEGMNHSSSRREIFRPMARIGEAAVYALISSAFPGEEKSYRNLDWMTKKDKGSRFHPFITWGVREKQNPL